LFEKKRGILIKVPKKKKRLKKVRNRIYDRQFVEKEQAQLRERGSGMLRNLKKDLKMGRK